MAIQISVGCTQNLCSTCGTLQKATANKQTEHFWTAGYLAVPHHTHQAIMKPWLMSFCAHAVGRHLQSYDTLAKLAFRRDGSALGSVVPAWLPRMSRSKCYIV